MRIKELSIVLFTLLFAFSCKQEETPPYGRFGDVVRFSGYDWDIKGSIVPVGPGSNFFSNRQEDVFVDDRGYLHLRIAEQDGVWHSTEIVSEDTMGYGTYKWTIEGDFVNIPDNIVIGLFTWDNDTFQEQANSEVDIEISKWGEDKENTLQYGVQPIEFCVLNPERLFNPDNVDELIGISTHLFHWTDTLISWESFVGEEVNEEMKFAEWTFGLDNPARSKCENGQVSDPVIIPEPGLTTNARINFWLQTWLSDVPRDTMTQELVVRSFDYTSDF